MKKTLFTLVFVLPTLAFAQLFTFNTGLDGWTKGTGTYTFNASSPLGQAVVNPNATTTQFLDFLPPAASVNSDYTKVRIRIKNTSSTPANIRFKDPAASTQYFNFVTISNSNTDYIDYIITGNATWTGLTGFVQPQFRITRASGNWDSNDIFIEEIEFGDDFYKHDYQFTNQLEGWAANNTGGNNSSVALSGGKMIVTPAGAANARVENASYSIDGTNNKYIHVFYKNNSANNNRLRANFFHSGDAYAAQKAISTETLVTNGNSAEAIFDASGVPEWTGTIRKLFFVLTSFDGTAENAANVDTGTLEIDYIVINNSGSTLATGDISKAKNLLQVVVADNTLHFRNATVNKATIYSMTGQIAKETKVSNNQTDVSSLKSGVYMVKAVAQDGSVTITKFFKK